MSKLNSFKGFFRTGNSGWFTGVMRYLPKSNVGRVSAETTYNSISGVTYAVKIHGSTEYTDLTGETLI
jgi:hypothetical protein